MNEEPDCIASANAAPGWINCMLKKLHFSGPSIVCLVLLSLISLAVAVMRPGGWGLPLPWRTKVEGGLSQSEARRFYTMYTFHQWRMLGRALAKGKRGPGLSAITAWRYTNVKSITRNPDGSVSVKTVRRLPGDLLDNTHFTVFNHPGNRSGMVQ